MRSVLIRSDCRSKTISHNHSGALRCATRTLCSGPMFTQASCQPDRMIVKIRAAVIVHRVRACVRVCVQICVSLKRKNQIREIQKHKRTSSPNVFWSANSAAHHTYDYNKFKTKCAPAKVAPAPAEQTHPNDVIKDTDDNVREKPA